ncbi:MAG: diadenylate cyclase CdaA [Chloroflexota bacterium]|nr:diadenylate cyclase CdaA [Chloroflexota bacterium]
MIADLFWYLQRLGWTDILDVLLVASVFFWLFYLVRGTRAVALLRGVIFLVIVVLLLGGLIELRAFGWLIERALPALLVAVPVIFQPELRRALEQLGRPGTLFGWTAGSREETAQALSTVTETAQALAQRHHGALIVLERQTGLQEFVESGVRLDAEVSYELLLTIFNPNTTLHDGAAIVREGRVLAAACVLPLSTAFLADRQLGLRHRAAIGVTEESDAVAVVVSEERGAISIAHNGRIIRNLDAKRLEKVLHAFYQPALERGWAQRVEQLRQMFGGES